jgi:hypothetical protein
VLLDLIKAKSDKMGDNQLKNKYQYLNLTIDTGRKSYKTQKTTLGQGQNVQPLSNMTILSTAEHWDTLDPYETNQHGWETLKIRGTFKNLSSTRVPNLVWVTSWNRFPYLKKCG